MRVPNRKRSNKPTDVRLLYARMLSILPFWAALACLINIDEPYLNMFLQSKAMFLLRVAQLGESVVRTDNISDTSPHAIWS